MTLPEAIVYLLASSNHGMKTDQIARLVNEKGLYQRWDKQPVTGKQVYAVVMAHPDMFVKSEGMIRLMILANLSTYFSTLSHGCLKNLS